VETTWTTGFGRRCTSYLFKAKQRTQKPSPTDAKNPLTITSYGVKDQRNVRLLVELAETLGSGVLESVAAYVNFPASHCAHLGSTVGGKDLGGHIKAADVILVFESEVPWVSYQPSPDTAVSHRRSSQRTNADALPVLKSIVPCRWEPYIDATSRATEERG
jgi:thiamine pyrophosphate-dependent acetolactate synthase large subunit-like protein